MLTAALPAGVGELCQVSQADGVRALGEVVGFDRGLTQIMPFETIDGVKSDARVFGLRRNLRVPVGQALLGRVLDGLGRPMDGRGPLKTRRWAYVQEQSPSPLRRPKIETPFTTGQRVIDGLITCGEGQRVALLAGSGVGKSTLLGEIARGASSDLNVIALIGERGREVRPFLEDCLGNDGLARSVVIVSTSDEPPLMRVRAAQAAVTIANYFRECGANVLFLLDSLTRMATAQREIGLLQGEPPSARGYTPSVFQEMSQLLEKLGRTDEGTITAICTVLVDGDDIDEPVSDAVRSFVDGHIVLDRSLAEKGHFPAVNVAASVSRVFPDVTGDNHRAMTQKIRAALAVYAEVADLVRIGAYTRGSDPKTDRALELMPAIERFLQQPTGTRSALEETLAAMTPIAAAWPF